MKKEQLDSKIKLFLNNLYDAIYQSNLAPKIQKAIRMFRKEKNLLYIDKTEDFLKAVIKSQTHPEKLEYACSIKPDGTFFCGTQNLYTCGGLRGSICKHIILALIGTIKQGLAQRSELINWVQNSLIHRPTFKDHKAEAAAIFLKYKNALDGKIEWRPVEIYPEDFSAF